MYPSDWWQKQIHCEGIFLNLSISNMSWNIRAEAWAQISRSTTLNFEKSYAVISFKIFNAVSREKTWKNWQSTFLYWLNMAALVNLRGWTQRSSHGKRKLSNEELMQTHEEFGLATWDLEKDCCNKEALVSDWIQTLYSEAIIKLKGASMRFKNKSPSKAAFKNEINNEHTPALLCITALFTDWVQNVPRHWILLNNSHWCRVIYLKFFICSLKSHWDKIIIIQHTYCFLRMVCFFKSSWTILYPWKVLYLFNR